ncbi:MAG: VWA domain-containing protein, partial [Acidobacteria bacterium]|nr:VWA domain-containing protein [Acidobacteriota bacterium]
MASIGHLDPRKSGSVSSPRSRRALAATLLLTAFAAAQDEKPTFQATTRLLEFSFAAVDKKGAPITDLRKDELVLLVDGKPYDLAFFRFEGSAAQAAPAPPALPPGIFTNRIELTGGPARNITALLIDSANTEPKDQMFVKAQALQFLAALAPQTHVAVFQLGQNLRVLHDFTSDMTSLRKSLKSVKVEFASPKLSDMERLATEADELLARLGASENSPLGGQLYTAVAGEANYNTLLQGNRVESTMTALDMLGRHLAGIPGRKSLIWISGGVAMTPVRVAPHRMPSQRAGQTNPAVGENHQKLIRAAAERLARSGIALYAVDARGIHSPADDLASRQEPPSRRGVFLEVAASESYGSDSRAGFDLLTTITGGRFIFGTNDFSQAIRKATADLHGSYSLGFYPRDPQPAGWRKLQVTVRRPGVTLLHPSGFSLDAPSGEF